MAAPGRARDSHQSLESILWSFAVSEVIYYASFILINVFLGRQVCFLDFSYYCAVSVHLMLGILPC